MTRAEYEAGRTVFRLLMALRKHANVRPGISPSMPRIARGYARLMLPISAASDQLQVPLSARLYWFRLEKDGLPF